MAQFKLDNNLSNIISNLEDNTLGINSTNALDRTNTIIPQVFDVDTTKDIEDKIKDNNVTYDFTKINNAYITSLEQNNKVSNNAYNICGVIIIFWIIMVATNHITVNIAFFTQSLGSS